LTSPPDLLPPSPPPGARAARTLAVLALGFAILASPLLWFALDPETRALPFLTIPLGLMFLMAPPLAARAMILGRRAQRRSSGALPVPERADLRMGLFALGVWVLLSALLVPLLARNGRGRARDKAALMNMQAVLAQLATAYGEASRTGLSEDRRIATLDLLLASQTDLSNPWEQGQRGLYPHIFQSSPGEAAAEAAARQRATTLGQAVFAVAAPPGASEPPWLVGAVLTRTQETRTKIVTRSKRLEP
jgi:hypothetical protein